jgi:probable F420-dependent oxidoreductase
MKIGLMAFLTAETIHPADLARKCESLGFDLLVFPEHPVIPVHRKTPFPRGDGKLPEFYSHSPDPFIALTLAATATTTLRIGTGICLIPEREPIVTAKSLATLDRYSNGRVVFGIGAGWLREETEVFGTEFRRRWPLTREYIRAMKELWTRPESSFEGEFIKFPAVRCFPKPYQKPHPPIWVGAAGERALKNTVAIGDGWMPLQPPPAKLAAELKMLEKLCAGAGRRFSDLELSITMGPEPAPDPRTLIKQYEDLGVKRMILNSEPIPADAADRVLGDMANKWIA